MLSSFARTLGAGVVISCSFVACDINTSTVATPAKALTESSIPTLPLRSPRGASPDHTVHYIKVFGDHWTGVCCYIAVDPVLNRIYVSSGSRLRGNRTVVVDGSGFGTVTTVKGFGGANNVDSKTHNVWLPGLDAGNVAVYSGTTDSIVTKVPLGDKPVDSWIDARRRYAWIAAQGGSDRDPVWAVNADTYAIVAGPIPTDGVMGSNIVNPVTGRYYVQKNYGTPPSTLNFEIDPGTFKVKSTSFGTVRGVDNRTDLLYAEVTNGLNIIDGRTEKIEKTVHLSYSPTIVAVNPSLNHIYLVKGLNAIEVRAGDTGALLKIKTLKSRFYIRSLVADEKRARIYASATTTSGGGGVYLYWKKD